MFIDLRGRERDSEREKEKSGGGQGGKNTDLLSPESASELSIELTT